MWAVDVCDVDTISVRVFCTVSDVEVNIGEEIVKEGLATYLSLPPTTPPHSSTGSEGEGSGEVAEEPSVNLTVQKVSNAFFLLKFLELNLRE